MPCKEKRVSGPCMARSVFDTSLRAEQEFWVSAFFAIEHTPSA
jgi:hypothetical protein